LVTTNLVVFGAVEGKRTEGIRFHRSVSGNATTTARFRVCWLMRTAMDQPDFGGLLAYLARVPAVQQPISHGLLNGGGWWIKFSLDISHRLAWNVVQELGHVLNYLSLNERLPTVFKPVSPPPDLNGGPSEFLSWVIECRDNSFTPSQAVEWLDGRLPRPADDHQQWGD
jgi:hypothetical protein